MTRARIFRSVVTRRTIFALVTVGLALSMILWHVSGMLASAHSPLPASCARLRAGPPISRCGTPSPPPTPSPTRSGGSSILQAYNPILSENQNPGTTDWQPTGNKTTIQAYAPESASLGDTIPLYVSMALPHLTFSLYVYRLGFYQHLGATLKYARQRIFDTYQGVYYTGLAQPNDCPTCVTQESYKGTLTDITEANWNPSYSFTIPSNWLSGLYFFIVSPGAQGPEDGWVVPVIIRDPVNSNPHHAAFVMIYPVATAQAYNTWGGTNLYADLRQQDGADPARAYAVSFNRPLSESDGLPTLLEGYQMARFLEQNGYNVTYTTDVAVSAGLTNLLAYKGIIVAGHWEYVDWNERQAIQNAVNAGRSFFALGGNNMYWQVRYDTGTTGTSNSTIRCYKDWTKDPVFGNLSTDLWRNYPVNLPEDILLKELYQHDASTQNTNFWATNAASWPYQGTGVSDGALAPAANIIGPEGDQTSPDSWTSDDHITILGSSPFVSGANTHMIATLLDELDTPSYHIVFDAGTILWTQALSDYTFPAFITVWQNPIVASPTLERMMNNMLRRVLQGGAPGVR